MKKVGAWKTTEHGGEVCYPDPLDGLTWDLDGSAKWVALVSSCCGGETGNPEHFSWNLTKAYIDGEYVGGNEKTREAARQKANEALIAVGWTLTPEETQ